MKERGRKAGPSTSLSPSCLTSLSRRRCFRIVLLFAVISFVYFVIRHATTSDATDFQASSIEWKEGRLGGEELVIPRLLLQQPPSSTASKQDKSPHLQGNRQPSSRAVTPTQGVVVVTGCLGSIGVALTQVLLELSIPVTCIDIRTPAEAKKAILSPLPAHLPSFRLSALTDRQQTRKPWERYFTPSLHRKTNILAEASHLFRYVQGDVRFPAKWAPLVFSSSTQASIRGVIHLAAISEPRRCASAPRFCADVNIGGTHNLLQLLFSFDNEQSREPAHSPWFIFPSSRHVYGNVSTAELPTMESAPKRPEGKYGKTKVEAEGVIEQFCEKRKSGAEGEIGEGGRGSVVRSVILRLANVYGSHSDAKTRLIPQLVMNAIRGLPLQVFGMRKKLDFVHIYDVMNAFLLAIKMLEEPSSKLSCGEAFNVGGGSAIAMKTVVDLVLNTTQARIPRILVTDNQERDVSGLNLKKINQVLGYQPMIFLRAGLKHYVEGIRINTMGYLSEQIRGYCGRDGAYSEAYEYLRNATLKLQLSGKCNQTYGQLSLDGLRSRETPAPICTNNNGRRKVKLKTFCEDLADALSFVNSNWKMEQTYINEKCGKWNDPDERSLPTCEYDCNHPTECLQTGRCQCVDYGRCGYTRPHDPPLSVAVQESGMKEPYWDQPELLKLLMTPLARDNPVNIPKLFVFPSKQEEPIECTGIHYDNVSCFGATARQLDGMRLGAVPAEEANLFVIPFHQMCSGEPRHYYNSAARALAKLPPKKDRSLLWIMNHDWSKCRFFHWTTTELRWYGHDKPYPSLEGSNVLQTNGDANTNCYSHRSDIVIPPETCNILQLLAVQPSDIIPIRKRQIDLFLAGSVYFQKVREKLLCKELYDKTRRLIVKHGRVEDYLPLLGNTKFCLCPRGVAGWAPRMIDSIGMGCIPVLISDYTVYPFQNLLDYSTFAIFLREVEIPVLQDILLGEGSEFTSWERMEEMQLAGLIVRKAFLYDQNDLMATHSPVELSLRALYLLRKTFRKKQM